MCRKRASGKRKRRVGNTPGRVVGDKPVPDDHVYLWVLYKGKWRNQKGETMLMMHKKEGETMWRKVRKFVKGLKKPGLVTDQTVFTLTAKGKDTLDVERLMEEKLCSYALFEARYLGG